jgi:Protein of unknown function (DUF935).
VAEDKKEIKSNSPVLDQIGSQIDTTVFAFDDAVFNSDRIGVKEYERMLETDETVGVSLEILSLSVLMRLGNYEHEDKKIAEFVNQNFEEMEGSLYSILEEILSALWAGFSGTEIIWEPRGGKVMLKKLATYHPETLLIRVDRLTGDYIGVKQWRWFAGSPVDIPRNKLILFSYSKKFGNHYGKSILKRIRKNWVLKDPILKMLARSLARFGTPFISAIVPDEMIPDPANPGQEISQLSYAIRILRDIENGTGIALRRSDGQGNDPAITVHDTNGSGIGQAFESALNYLNKMIARGLLAPSLLMDEGQRGAYSLGQAHMATFEKSTRAIYWQLAECLLEQLVRPMIDYNFGAQENYGKFQERELKENDMEVLNAAVSTLTSSGFIDPEVQEDFDEIRSRYNFPARKVSTRMERISAKAKEEFSRYKDEES